MNAEFRSGEQFSGDDPFFFPRHFRNVLQGRPVRGSNQVMMMSSGVRRLRGR